MKYINWSKSDLNVVIPSASTIYPLGAGISKLFTLVFIGEIYKLTLDI